jgi:hypothetical protein
MCRAALSAPSAWIVSLGLGCIIVDPEVTKCARSKTQRQPTPPLLCRVQGHTPY